MFSFVPFIFCLFRFVRLAVRIFPIFSFLLGVLSQQSASAMLDFAGVADDAWFTLIHFRTPEN